MTPEDKPSPEASAESVAPESVRGGTPAPAGFARLARRISSWTSRFVVSAMILVAALAVGREVLDWWNLDEAAPAGDVPPVAMTDGLADPAQPHEFEFGEAPWAMVREIVAADRQQAVAALRARCRQVTSSASLPGDAPDRSETQLLASLAGLDPVAEGPGGWQVYELDASFPMAVGVRAEAGGAQSAPTSQVADREGRVVTWGLAIPTAKQAWTLYTFHPAGDARGSPEDWPEIPLPPGSRKTMSMRVCGGGGMVAFRGPSETSGWQCFFDKRLQELGWTPAGSRHEAGSLCHLRYVRGPGGAAQTADIRFGSDARGGATGLVMISPSKSKSAESESL